MSKRIYFQHDFYENAIKGLLWYLRELMKPYANTLTDKNFFIGMKNTGDEKFLFDQIDSKHLYDSIPRWELDFLGINTLDDDRTNPRENGNFVAETTTNLGEKRKMDFSAPVARRPTEIGFDSQVLFSNVFEYLRFVEIYLILSTYSHTYKFYHAGKLHIGTFTFQDLTESTKNVTFGMEAEKRERKIPIAFTVVTQFPAYQIYGIPGTGNEGFNGDDGDGSGGGTDDFLLSPMIKIIQNQMLVHNFYQKPYQNIHQYLMEIENIF
jgi:hypothetical protein